MSSAPSLILTPRQPPPPPPPVVIEVFPPASSAMDEPLQQGASELRAICLVVCCLFQFASCCSRLGADLLYLMLAESSEDEEESLVKSLNLSNGHAGRTLDASTNSWDEDWDDDFQVRGAASAVCVDAQLCVCALFAGP
jgi:hypothetical protein